jgi:hypothetical protein
MSGLLTAITGHFVGAGSGGGETPPTPPFTVACVPPAASVTWPSGPNGDVYVPIMAVPSNGRAPFTYSWLYVSGDIINVVTATRTQQTCQFYLYGNVPLRSLNQCTVTDADGKTAVGYVTIDGHPV